jgi:hypothetical protein
MQLVDEDDGDVCNAGKAGLLTKERREQERKEEVKSK